MAKLAVLSDHFAILTDVISFMATKAAGIQCMADVVWVSAPVDLHLGENIGAINSFDLGNRLFDGLAFGLVHLWILSVVKTVQRCRNAFARFFSVGINDAERVHGFFFDVWKGPIDKTR